MFSLDVIVKQIDGKCSDKPDPTPHDATFVEYCGFIYCREYQFLWIDENLHFRWFLVLWFCPSLQTKPIEMITFVEHLYV